MPFKWDPVAERNLLLHAIAGMQGPVATIWPKVAEKLGGGLNANACSQKFYKLKKESEKLLSGDGIGAPAETSTPKKTTKTNKTNGATTTPASKRKKKANAIDDDAATTPSKKIKQEAEAEESEREETDGAEVKAEVDGA